MKDKKFTKYKYGAGSDGFVLLILFVIFIIDGIKDYLENKEKVKPKEDEEISKLPKKNEFLIPNEIDLSKFKDHEYEKAVNHFVKTLQEYVEEEDLDNLKYNIKSLEIKNKKFKRKNSTYTGSYSPESNKIMINGDFKAIYHELLHMSSSNKIDNILYSGFLQRNYRTFKSIGIGLDEGYTSVLACDLFNDAHVSYLYGYLFDIALDIENLIGEEKMMHLYFTADLYNLVEELSAYACKEDILCFLENMDELHKKADNESRSIIHRKEVELLVENIQSFLIKCNVRKIYLEYETASIDKVKEFKKRLNTYMKNFYETYPLCNKEIDSISLSGAQRSFEESFLSSDEIPYVRKRKEE